MQRQRLLLLALTQHAAGELIEGTNSSVGGGAVHVKSAVRKTEGICASLAHSHVQIGAITHDNGCTTRSSLRSKRDTDNGDRIKLRATAKCVHSQILDCSEQLGRDVDSTLIQW